jgi:hypothetical protein
MEQAKRFDAMSLHQAKSLDLAASQATEIAQWSSKLVDAVNKVLREAEAAATACHENLQNRIRELKTQADSTKRKMLETKELESSRTIRANFRLIFGPARRTEYRSKSSRDAMSTNLERITTIRELCESYPDGVIALSTSYPTKVWTESRPEVFDGILKLVKQEPAQDWPDEIVDIMNEIELERPMSAEFRNLRGMLHGLF